jgi:hypothetical protein
MWYDEKTSEQDIRRKRRISIFSWYKSFVLVLSDSQTQKEEDML